MSDTDRKILVVDHGQFPYIAQRLSRELNVAYYSPDERAMPLLREGSIGDGFPEVKRVRGIWDKRVNTYCFPDIGFESEQKMLDSMAYACWGAQSGDRLEWDRGYFLKTLAQVGLEVPPHRVLYGMAALKSYLQGAQDKWIKVSKWRGDWETLHWRSWAEDEIELISRELRLGPLKEHITFYVFDELDIAVEDGVDTWCIYGNWPKTVIHGMEKKDKFFIATFTDYDKLPKEMRQVNEAIGPVLARHQYRGAFSTEVCITPDKTPYFTDATCRFGSPPSQLQMEMIGNWGEIVWEGARGNLVEPVIEHQFGIQGVVELCADASEWAVLDLPKELRQWVKCSFCGELDGKIVFPPMEGVLRAWLLGVGDSIQDAIAHFKDNAEMLPDGAHCSMEGLDDLLEEVKTAENMGMEFTTEPVPEHA